MEAKAGDSLGSNLPVEVENWPNYADPEADVVLQTTDSRRFRVHSYFLRAASIYFRHLLDPGPTLGCKRKREDDNEEEVAIDIECDARTLDRLLFLVTSQPIGDYSNWTKIEEILEVGQRYQFDTLPRLIVPHINPCVSKRPWQVFVFASQNDFEWLAKSAIANLGKDLLWKMTTLSTLRQSDFEKVPYKYFVALVRAMASSPQSSLFVDYAKAAEAFNIAHDGPRG